MPPFLREPLGLLREPLGALSIWQWLASVAAVVLGVALGSALAWLLRSLTRRLVRTTRFPWDDVFVAVMYRPARVFWSLLLTYMGLSLLGLPRHVEAQAARLTRAACFAVVGWGVIRALYALAEAMADTTEARDTSDPVTLERARALRTQIIVAYRAVSLLVFVVACALVALQFQAIRAVGMSLLASAGVAGIALGFAAQKSLGVLLAGLQVSVSQPIRLGDTVVMQGEYGIIEDIGLTYVTVRLWDERRMIVPTPRFLEQPFENWSRSGRGLLGAVSVRVEFDVPVQAVRAEFERIIGTEPLWDRRIKNVQVVDAAEKSLTLRLLMSARSPEALWDLRASIREQMVGFLQVFSRASQPPVQARIGVGAPDEQTARAADG